MIVSQRARQRARIVLKLLPILFPYVAFFLTGLVLSILQSFGIFIPLPTPGTFLESYGRLFSSVWFYRSFGFSLYVAFCSATAAVLIGTALSYFIWKLPLKLQKYTLVYKVPLIMPHIAVAFIILVFFSRSGFLAALLHRIGFIEGQNEFPAVLFAGNGIGLMLAYVYKEIPFVVLMVSAILIKFDPRYVHAADMLGARRSYTFYRVILPFLLPIVHTTFIILFLYSFGAFDIPYLLSESDPQMLSIYVYNLYFKRDLMNRPYAMAVLVFMFLFAAFFIVLYMKLVEKIDIRVRKL